jgi:hypothetical protein
MRSKLFLLVAILVSAALSSPTVAQAKQSAGANAGVKAKCQQKYPDMGTTQVRRSNAAMRRQCIANGGST